MSPGKEKHQFYLEERDLKCFQYLCNHLEVSMSEQVGILIQDFLRENEREILRAIEDHKLAVQKRKIS